MKRLMQSPLVRVLTVVFFQYTFPLYNGLGESISSRMNNKIGKAIYYTMWIFRYL